MSAREPERGSVSVVLIGVIGAITVLLAAVMVLAGVVRDTHRARNAADLSALAGANRLAQGEAVAAACTAAGQLAGANDAELTGCQVSGLDVRVTVRIPTRFGYASGSARAGPAQ